MARTRKTKKGGRSANAAESVELTGKSVKAKGKHAVRWTLALLALLGILGLALHKSATVVSSSGSNSPAIGSMEKSSLKYGSGDK